MSEAVSRRLVLLGGAALSLASGCTRHRPLTTLRVAFSPTTLSGMYRELAGAFERAHPGTRVELIPAVTYGAVMQRDFRLALIEDEPDVSHVGLNHIRFYVERGLALPLDSLIDRSRGLPLTAHPAIGKVAGATYALPFAVSVPVSYFNGDLIRRAGRDPQALLDADWPALVDTAAAVSRLGGPVSGIFFDYTPESALAWQMLVLSRGGRMMSPDERRIAFDGPAGLWSAELLGALGRAGQRDLSRENARMAFAAGQLGIYQNTSANIARFSTSRSGFPLTLAPLPTLSGRGRLPAAGNAAMIVTRKAERQKRAWDYVRFACGPIGQTIVARTTGYMSLNRAALDDPAMLQAIVAGRPYYRRLYDHIDRLDAWFAFPGPRSDQIAQMVSDTMRELLLGRIAPRAGLARMADDARRLIGR